MQVFVFDWMAYGQSVDRFRVNGEMPKLGRREFDAQVAVETYRNHLAAWAEMERQGFDGIAINEHHSTPFGLNNSPNLIAAAISQLTTKMKILIYANLLPLHDPLRVAEDAATVDVMSNGRFQLGVAAGYRHGEFTGFGVPMKERAARMDEALP
ncbi:MAG TPA: LLM class flavin-dependent oxidoreductase, partial [Steroidobacteraceae bacterium]|nr:LLM class flavin-dependent oxidoreductase [Steroidobacteraceae bacterium]